ncbi:hypothetical protein D7V93_14515 [Corallococcus llansteffanensis]|uniref:Uncharacterized protein n=2 Tax=Corallococcus llansteffanensis TaxID=2316731 RepID=A0A3A8PT60_9BACT|nr:hypothetical protein D7V93_14515 [Corallococcus llansteffanensis]
MCVLAWGGGLPPSAEACSGPVCDLGGIVPPTAGAAVPANVPALVIVPSLFQSMDAGSVHLRTAEGTDVAAGITQSAHGSAVVAPAAPLVPGAAYRLEGDSPCPYGPDTLGVTFTASEPLPLPGATGLLEAGPEQQGNVYVIGGATCAVETRGSSLRLRFTPAPELVPFLPWVHWTVEVDGKPWASAPHGSLGPTGELAVTTRLKYTRDLLWLYTVCEVLPEAGQPQDMGLEPGRHVATLRPVLEHLDPPLPSVEVPFELTCPKKSTEPDPVPNDEGCSQAGGGLTALGLFATLQLWRRRARGVRSA